MTITMRNAMSASMAFVVTCEPQLDPTVVIDTSFDDTLNLWAIADWIFSDWPVFSWLVCTCQLGALPLKGLISVTVGFVPPLFSTTCDRSVCVTAADEGTLNSEPPLNSTLNASPRKISATMLMTRMAAEIVYQSR